MTSLPLVLLTGASGTGKSQACALVRRAVVVSMDDYYFDEGDSRVPMRRGRPNWDAPESIDLEALRRAVETVRRGEVASVPSYDMRASKRLSSKPLDPGGAQAVLVEGIFSFLVGGTSPVTRVLLDCPSLLLMWRRLKRDIRQGRRPLLRAASHSLARVFSDVSLVRIARKDANATIDARLRPALVAARLDDIILALAAESATLEDSA